MHHQQQSAPTKTMVPFHRFSPQSCHEASSAILPRRQSSRHRQALSQYHPNVHRALIALAYIRYDGRYRRLARNITGIAPQNHPHHLRFLVAEPLVLAILKHE